MDEFTVTIEKLLYGGDGLARRDGKAVFIPHSIPGDELRVWTVEEKKNYIRAGIARMLRPGSGRIDPACPYFGRCGGCDWQQLEYARQVESKRQILEELFHHRFPETRNLSITMKACPQPFGYRSRARAQRRCDDENVVIGFFRNGSHVVENIESCLLFRPKLNEALRALRQAGRRLPGLMYRKGVSREREIDIACSEEEGFWIAEPSGIEYEPSEKQTLLRRKIGGFTYAVSASTFFQANDFMTGELVARVMNCVAGIDGGTALDLFSGVGLFSLPLARRFRTVTAVEYARPSHQLCVANARFAGLGNIQSVCADAGKWLESLDTRSGDLRQRFDVIVLDPPRAGVGADVMKRIGRLSPQIIVYVSCDPQTLVRDIGGLEPWSWRIESIEGLDMFPQTYHFETVVRLARN